MADTDSEGREEAAADSDTEADSLEPGAPRVPVSSRLPKEVDQRLSELFGRSPSGQPDEEPASSPQTPRPPDSSWNRLSAPPSAPPVFAPQRPPSAPAAPGSSNPTSAYTPYALPPTAPASPPAHRSRRTFAFVLAAVAVLLIGTGVVVFALNGNGTNPTSAVETAVANLHRAKTAQIAMALSVDAGGQAIKMTGNGETNVLTDATNETITYNLGGGSFTARAILDGPTAYFNYGAVVGRMIPGKSWVSMDLGQSGASGSQGMGIYSDPVAMLAVLGSKGTVVRALGSSNVNGVEVQGYGIDLGAAGIARLVRSGHFPSSMKTAMESSHFSRLDYTAFVDASNRLSDVRTVANYSFAGHEFTAQGDMSLSDYGVRVSITDPPASQVVPFQQFEKVAAQSRGTATS